VIKKSKIQSKLKKLKQAVGDAKNVYILIYSNPDPDGLGSAWALKEILNQWGVNSFIGYTGEVGRLQNASMIQSLRLPAERVNLELLHKADRVAMVDSQPSFFTDLELPRIDMVIDHHPGKTDPSVPFSDIRHNVLSTCSMLTEYLIALGKPIPKRLATALYYGIETDSRGQQKSPSPTDSEAILHLDKLADRNLLRRIEFSQYSFNDLDYFNIALIKRRYARNVLYSHIGAVPYTDVCVQVADFMIRVKESNWALVTGVVKNKLVIVFRCDGHQKNAGKVAQAAFGEMGSAGGHRTMGRAEIPGKSLPKGVSLTQNEKLEWFVVSSLARADSSFRPLQRYLRKEGLAQPILQEDSKGNPN